MMTNMVTVSIAVEGKLDEAVLTKLLLLVGIKVAAPYGKKGKDYLKKKIRGYNQAAKCGDGWIVLVDLDNDAECAPPFVASWLPDRSPNLQLRVAVRAVESWLLADSEEIAHFLGVPRQKIPAQPENEVVPKNTLINIARRSRSREIREDIVPRPDSSASQGPGYTSRLVEFTMRYWDPERAARRAPSLKRTFDSLLRWKADNDEITRR
jgi:hypothetical protein